MKHNPTMRRRALPLLLAAAAIPFTALSAQDTTSQPPAQDATPPASQTSDPVQTPAPTPPVATTQTTTPAPTVTTTEPAAETAETQQPAQTARTATPRTAPRATRTTVQPRAQATVRSASPAAVTPAPLEAPLAEAEPLPPPVAAPPLDAAAAGEAPPVDAAAAAEREQQGGGSIWPWLLLGALAIAAIALFARRRRSSLQEEVYSDEAYHEEPVAEREPVMVAAPPMAAAPAMAAPAAFAAHDTPEAAAAVASEARPWLELGMRPVRAGVGDDRARVEFELTVGNTGSAPARDVRISTWMLPAGTSQGSEMERSLIEQRDDSNLPEVTIDAGSGKRIEAAVDLPRAGLHDAILPVVVADARYRLPDGSEGRTSMSFAVGVPDGEELAHFDVEHPSGMHEDVEARALGEPQQV